MINKVVDLVNELQEIAESNYMHISICSFNGIGVHISLPVQFFSLFDQFDIEPKENIEYPYEVITEIDGVKFTTFLTQEDYEKYVRKTA